MRSVRSISATRDNSVRSNRRNSAADSTATGWHTKISAPLRTLVAQHQSCAVRDVEFARSGETQVAYRVLGEAGRVDVVVVAGALFPFELLTEDRVAARFVDGLAALG